MALVENITIKPSNVAVEPQGTLAEMLTPYFTPEQWGAAGDGSTVDTVAIQAAIDYVSSIGGGTVLVGPFTYRAAGLVLKPSVRLLGSGQYNTTIKAPNGWDALAVIASVDFQLYSTGSTTNLTANGSYAASVESMNIDGNYDNFGGTPSKFVGMGLALAGICNVRDLDIVYAPSTGYVHLNFTGSPNTPPSYWPANKGLKSSNDNANLSVKWCGNDCAYVENYDSVYNNVLFGLPARGVGASITSFWDTARTVACVNFAGTCYVDKAHAYGYTGGYGIVWGHGDYTRGYLTYRYNTVVCETVCCGMWVRPTAKVDGIRVDLHNVSMNLNLPELGTAYGAYAPGCLVQSGQFITSRQTSRQQSDLGKITFWNFTTSGSQPTIGFMGTHVVLAGENNTVDLDLHRSRFLSPALGGLGLMCAGINNTVRGRITGFLGTDSSGADSAAIQFQPGSVTHFDGVSINRCNVGARWSSNASQPVATGTLNITDNVSTYMSLYSSATLLQRSRLTVNTSSGSNKMSVLGASGAVSVTSTSQQTVTISGLDLPYVPALGEVQASVVNLNQPQSQYPGVKAIQYLPASSSLTALAFAVRMHGDSGDAAGATLMATLG